MLHLRVGYAALSPRIAGGSARRPRRDRVQALAPLVLIPDPGTCVLFPGASRESRSCPELPFRSYTGEPASVLPTEWRRWAIDLSESPPLLRSHASLAAPSLGVGASRSGFSKRHARCVRSWNPERRIEVWYKARVFTRCGAVYARRAVACEECRSGEASCERLRGCASIVDASDVPRELRGNDVPGDRIGLSFSRRSRGYGAVYPETGGSDWCGEVIPTIARARVTEGKGPGQRQPGSAAEGADEKPWSQAGSTPDSRRATTPNLMDVKKMSTERC